MCNRSLTLPTRRIHRSKRHGRSQNWEHEHAAWLSKSRASSANVDVTGNLRWDAREILTGMSSFTRVAKSGRLSVETGQNLIGTALLAASSISITREGATPPRPQERQ